MIYQLPMDLAYPGLRAKLAPYKVTRDANFGGVKHRLSLSTWGKAQGRKQNA